MVQKSCVRHLRLVVYPIIYKVLDLPGGCFGISEPSTVFHQALIWRKLPKKIISPVLGVANSLPIQSLII